MIGVPIVETRLADGLHRHVHRVRDMVVRDGRCKPRGCRFEVHVLSISQLTQTRGVYEVRRYHRFWEVLDAKGELVCVTVHKRGAQEVVRRLRSAAPPLGSPSSMP